MATSTSSGAVYGVGVYGVAEYGVANVTVIPDGVQASVTSDSGLIIEADGIHDIVDVTEFDLIGAVGDVGISAGATVVPTGAEVTGSIGTITQKTVNRVPVTGVEGTGELGTLDFIGDSNYVLDSGVSGSLLVGTVVVAASAPVPVTGVTAATNAGVVTILENEVQIPTGVSATGVAGTVSISTTSFDYNAVASQYAAARAVLVLRRTTSKDRTVRVPAAA